jgi:hypothetical protein
MHQYLTAMQTVEAWSLCLERPSDKMGEEAGENVKTNWSGKKKKKKQCEERSKKY